MQLTDVEKAILDGREGEPARFFLEMLVTLGKIYDAPCLIPVRSAHASGLSVRTLGEAGIRWAEDIAAAGGRVRIPTSMNVIGIDRLHDLHLPREWVERQQRVIDAYRRMGCYVTSSCVPYYQGFLPRFGEHLAWGESSAVVFVNSVIGARNNREGGPSTLASAITGRTPYYGLHLAENRRGQFFCQVEVPLRDMSDFGALGAFTAAHAGQRIPVFGGVTAPALENLVALCASLASWGGTAMFHMVGVTPEAPSAEAALGGVDCERIVFGPRELEEQKARMNSARDRHVDLVALGCPHCSLNQLAEIAGRLEGRRLADGVTLWVQSNASVRAMAAQLGYVATIENAGGLVTQDLCVVLSRPEDLGFTTLATNSAKMCFYAPGSNGIPVWYGSLDQCISAALTGRWE